MALGNVPLLFPKRVKREGGIGSKEHKKDNKKMKRKKQKVKQIMKE